MDASTASPSSDLLLRHHNFVRALSRELLSDEHLAEDVAQEAALRFLEKPPRAENAARSWLRSVTTRLSIEGLRTRARREAREERVARVEAQSSAEEELAHTEVLRTVVDAVLALDEPYRTTVLLAYWRGWDAHRIADETETPLATVRSRLQRAQKNLRERLDKSHGRASWALALGTLSRVDLVPDLTSSLADSSAALSFGSGAKLALAGIVVAGLFFYLSRALRREEPELLLAGSGLASEGPRLVVPEADEPTALPATRTEVPPLATGLLRITGTLTDRAYAELGLAEKPARGVALRLALAPERYSFQRLGTAETRTDDSGRFVFELADPGPRPVWVKIASEADADYRKAWHDRELADMVGEVALQRVAHGVLHGTATDPKGNTLAGVRVQIGEREAASAADGSFALPRIADARNVKVELAGHTLLGREEPRPLEEGGWTPMRVCLGPAAALRVTLSDRAGKPLVGANVSAVLPECEQATLPGDFEEQSRRAKTDEGGSVLLEGLWAERKLRLTLQWGKQSLVVDGVHGGRLVLDGPHAGTPLVLAPGETRELEALLETVCDLAGRVLLPGGAPAAGALVQVFDAGGPITADEPELLRMEAGPDGRFAAHLAAAELAGALRVSARAAAEPNPGGGLGAGELKALRGLGYVNSGPSLGSEPGGPLGAELEVDARDSERLGALALELQPRFSITGLVRDGAGARFDLTHGRMGRMWAAPSGAPFHGLGQSAQLSAEGFAFDGLAPGRYDLFLSEELEGFYSFENFVHVFPGIEAGARGVELTLPERREVRIRVRVAPGSAAEGGLVLHRRFFPADPRGFRAPKAAPTITVRGAAGWPRGTVFDFTGIGGDRTEAGWSHDGYDGFEGGEHALQPLEPGWYALGLTTQGGGKASFPQATPLLWFDAGEYTVEFEPLPQAELRGRVLGDAAGEFLAVALLDDGGQGLTLAPLPGFARPTTVVDVSARGEFVLHRAPAGRYRLRAGSRAELERGEFRREVVVELAAGENGPVEVRL